jgi:hypothetical protein
MMAGSADDLLKVVAEYTEDVARTHRQSLARLPGVAQMQSSFALWNSDNWCGFGIQTSRFSAEAMFEAPEEAMPAFAETVETWQALVVPVQHRGQVNWRGVVENNRAIRPCGEVMQGPFAVMTSASFDDPKNPDELPRISRFAVKVSEAIEFLGAQPGNLRRDLFNGGFDGIEGFTLTPWESDEAMLKAAYHSGHHRKLMDESRDGSTFDRSLFTRLRIIDSHRSWSGPPFGNVGSA